MKKVLFLLLALIVIALPVAAQDQTLGLGEDDFAFWTNAIAESAAFDTLTYNYSLSIVVAGIDTSDIDVSVSGGGVIGTQGETPLFSNTAVGTISAGGDTLPVDFEVRFIGDMVFVNLDGTQWMGGRAEDVLGGALEAFGDGAGLPVDDLLSGDIGGLFGGADASALDDAGDIDPSQFINVTRMGSVFTTTIDIAALLRDPQLAPIFGGALGGGAEMTPQETQQMSMMLGMLFGDAVVQYVQTLNSDDLVQTGELTINFPLDAIVAPGAGISLTLMVELSGYNAPISIDEPASFEPLEM